MVAYPTLEGQAEKGEQTGSGQELGCSKEGGITLSLP